MQNDNKDVVIFLRHLERFDNADGLHMLGIMYLNGYCGLGKSYYLANYYFKRAGEFGSALAWKDLADSYLVGHGVKKDEQLALEFYIKSAQLGCGSAQFNAGIMFKTGQGTKIDTKKACHYLRLASLNPDLGVLQLDADHHLREARIMHPR
ncbi:MAG: tetratricopeptide repeat protein [Alphaproteobacteria bacterium]|nr:tetratricopeptide repeat protein [Alphaproteobacteria bacterium]